MSRRTRFVCVSDTHNASPEQGAFKLPKGDVLIHAGDLTKQGTMGELQKTISWIERADFEVKIVIAGNHDITLDHEFYAEHGSRWHNQTPQDPKECIRLLRESSSIIYLENEAVDIQLKKDTGARTKFRIFGSPCSPRLRTWAFQYAEEAAPQIWSQIPLDADIVVTHTPPRFHCDWYEDNMGCEALRQALWRVRPRLAVCGHIHNSRGAERIQWDLSDPNVKHKELSVGQWDDTSKGTKKQSLVDLSARGGDPLRNDGSDPTRQDVNMVDLDEPQLAASAMVQSVPSRGDLSSGAGDEGDLQEIHGRLGRKETCVVNASIMATSYPYKGNVGERYNKPIVVDLDLPIADL